jgi:hypothetical protein
MMKIPTEQMIMFYQYRFSGVYLLNPLHRKQTLLQHKPNRCSDDPLVGIMSLQYEIGCCDPFPNVANSMAWYGIYFGSASNERMNKRAFSRHGYGMVAKPELSSTANAAASVERYSNARHPRSFRLL